VLCFFRAKHANSGPVGRVSRNEPRRLGCLRQPKGPVRPGAYGPWIKTVDLTRMKRLRTFACSAKVRRSRARVPSAYGPERAITLCEANPNHAATKTQARGPWNNTGKYGAVWVSTQHQGQAKPSSVSGKGKFTKPWARRAQSWLSAVRSRTRRLWVFEHEGESPKNR
jgi:hypothetical protein